MRLTLTAAAPLLLCLACSPQSNDDGELDVCLERSVQADGNADSFVAAPNAVYFSRFVDGGAEVVRAGGGLEIIDRGTSAVRFLDATEGSVLFSIGRENQSRELALYSSTDASVITIDDAGPDFEDRRRRHLDGDRIVWSRGGTIHVRDSDGLRSFGDGETARNATAADGRIVWTQDVDGVRQVFELVDGLPVARTVGGEAKSQPLVSGGMLAWIERDVGVFVTRDEQTNALYLGRCFELSGNEDLLALACADGELYAAPHDGAVTRIASVGGTSGGSIHSPRVEGDTIAWVQPDDWNGEDPFVAAELKVWRSGKANGIARLAPRCRLCSFVGPIPRVELSSGFAIWNYASSENGGALEFAARCNSI